MAVADQYYLDGAGHPCLLSSGRRLRGEEIVALLNRAAAASDLGAGRSALPVAAK